jgi:lipopolysaccharide export system permease protein
MFNLVDRYITKMYLKFFFAGVIVLLTLFLVIDFMGNIARFDTTLNVLLRYYSYYGLEILYQFLPVASLVGTVFTFSVLNNNRELTSLFSFGMSLRRILRPLLICIVITMALSYFLDDQVLPVAKQKGDYIFYVEMQKKPGLYSTVKSDKIWYRIDNSIINIQLLDSQNLTADGVTIYYFTDSWKIQQIIQAKQASITASEWNLKSGTSISFVEDLSVPLVQSFAEKNIEIPIELNDLQTSSSASDLLSFRQLKKYIAKNKNAGLDMTRFEVDYQHKLSFPFTIFVLSMVGVPFVIKHQRASGIGKNVGLVLFMTIIFQLSYSISLSLGRNAVIHPIISAWGPNLIFLAWAIYLFRKKD